MLPELRSDAATLRDICQRFGLEGRPLTMTSVARGAMGRIWRLDLGSGEVFAVKELFWGGDEAGIEQEVAFTELAIGHGIKAPTSFRSVDGRYLVRLGGDGPLVRLYSWVSGEPIPSGPRHAAWLGETLATLHELNHRPGEGEPDPWYDHVPSVDRWATLVEAAGAGNRSWRATLEAAIPRLRELAELVHPIRVEDTIWCHCDVDPPNVLLAPSGELVLLDWENAGPTDPVRELASHLLSWRFDDEGVRRCFLSYGKKTGRCLPDDLGVFGNCIAGVLNYLASQADFCLDESQPDAMRTHAEGAVQSILADLPTIEGMRHVLDVARTG